MLNKSLFTHGMHFDEGVIKKSLSFEEVGDKRNKWNKIVNEENEKMRKDPTFPRFLIEEKD